MTVTADAGTVEERLQAILAHLLVLKPREITPDRRLVEELDVDSLTFIELTFAIEEQFGIEFPDVKSDGELLALPVPEGIRRIEAMPGGATLFEFMKDVAVTRLRGERPSVPGGEERDRLFEQVTVGDLARTVGGSVPAGLDPDAPLAHLPLAQLFRFPTVHVMARYIEFLVATQRPER